MKLYEIIIKPISAFGTPLKGDTIFGQFCWQTFYDNKEDKSEFKRLIETYHEHPFVIFSSAFPVIKTSKKTEKSYALKMPDIPLSLLFPQKENLNHTERIEYKKQIKIFKNKKWMVIDHNLEIDFSLKNDLFFTDQELLKKFYNDSGYDSLIISSQRTQNTINRLTNTTGEDQFAPFPNSVFNYLPDIELALFVLVDEDHLSIQTIVNRLEKMGETGFGKDSSTGMGRFKIIKHDPLAQPNPSDIVALYTLAPHVFGDKNFEKEYFQPFVRFGKHGSIFAAAGNPFKKPIMMANEGAVLAYPINENPLNKSYVGKAVTKNISKPDTYLKDKDKTVHQGYSPYLIIKNWC